MHKFIFLVFVSTASLLAFTQGYAQPMTEAEMEKWLNSDAPVTANRQINEGKLVFLPRHKASQVMHSDNTIIIGRRSLDNGWVRLRQCYHNLDAFPRVQVVYHYKQMKQLKIVSSSGIGRAWVTPLSGKDSVQLQQVKQGASLCVSAWVKALQREPSGRYRLKTGPYRRKFLDGYFPLRMTLRVDYPSQLLQIAGFAPQAPGMKISRKQNQLVFDAVFEGELNTQVNFARR